MHIHYSFVHRKVVLPLHFLSKYNIPMHILPLSLKFSVKLYYVHTNATKYTGLRKKPYNLIHCVLGVPM